MSRAQEIVSKVRSVKLIPPVAARVFQLLQDPDISMAELTGAIQHEPGLTTNLLRLANSSFFSWSRKIGSVQEAILRLGTDTVFQLVVTSLVAPVARRAVKGYGLPAGELWRHSVAVAIGTGELATALHLNPSDFMFTASLLHDIGKIVLGTFVDVDATPITALAFREKVPFQEAEKRVLGIDHAEVGAVLLESWNLPPEIILVVRWHHQPDRFSGATLAGDLVHAADALCMMGGIGTGIDGLNYRLSKQVVSRLHLTTQAAETAACQTLGRLEEMHDLFSTTTGR
jgi:putative nucleotidyltransferase with HDIG domain